MGNSKLRRQVCSLYKERGYGRLYGGRIKRLKYSFLTGRELRNMLLFLQFKVGDVVYENGFNQKIVKIKTPKFMRMDYPHSRGWVRADYDGDLHYHNGGLSWRPEPPRTQEQIENMWAAVSEDYYNNWLRPDDPYRRMIDDVRAGKHIVDENGFLLPKYFDINFKD